MNKLVLLGLLLLSSCGMDCPPYTDWVEYRVCKAPQSWQYAWLWE